MSISVLVVDATRKERGRAQAESFYHNGVTTYFYDGQRLFLLPDWDIDQSTPRQVSVTILHNTDKKVWEKLNCIADIVIRYTGGSPPIHTHLDEIWIRARSIASGEDAINQNEAREIIEWFSFRRRGQINQALPDLLQSPKVTQLLPALSILCQGYLAVHAKYDKANQCWGPPEIATALQLMGWTNLTQSNQAALSNTLKDKVQAITAPQWWLEVFGLWDATKAKAAEDTKIWEAFEQGVKDEWQEDRYGPIDTSLLTANDADNSVMSSLRKNVALSSPDLIAQAYSALVKRLTHKQYI